MFEQHFANYLVEKQRISETQHALVTEQQTSARVKLGLIAVAERLLTHEQAERLNALQRQTDRRFGDLAVENGYLSADQVDKLLEMQGNPYLKLVQILTENEILTMEQIESFLRDYQLQHGFSHDDLQVLKSGNLELIIPLFVQTDQALATKYMSLAIRSVIRLINNQPLLGKMEKVTTYSFGNLAFQETTGDHDLWLGFGSKGDELTEIATPFAKEAFSKMDEDAFDSVCEFINCINGLFTTELSYHDVVLDMQPPLFAQNQSLSRANGFFIVPIELNGRQTDLIVGIDGKVEIN
ncbi:MAG TPA: hypothetical protein DDZ66_04560 [Firmicutes bacterium]|nr:hypothetical protein [Bacillota bacterium]